MNIIELFIISNICILFPFSMYLIFIYFKNKLNIKENDIYLELVLYLIMFSLLYIYYRFNIKTYLCYFSIPILIALLNNKKYTALIMSIICIVYCYQLTNINVLFLSSIVIVYFLLHKYYNIRNKSKFFLTNYFALVKSLYTLVYYLIFYKFYLENFIIIILYIVSIYIITYVIIKIRDTLKLYVSLQEIEEDKQLKTYIFKVTHEIKNPLTVIRGYLSILDHKDQDKCLKYKNIMQKELENSLQILEDFSQINNLSITKTKININDLLHEINESIIPQINNKNISYTIKSTNKLMLYADYNRLKQVLINIIKNSIEAMENNGIMEIKARKKKNNIIISIKDNGSGMDKDTIDNLFIPFYSKKNYGHGLGLCISKEIIEKHNGIIEYTSVQNKYTIAKILLPIINNNTAHNKGDNT